MRIFLSAVCFASAIAASPTATLSAQQRRPGSQGQEPGVRGERMQDRRALETRFRERFRSVIRQRLNASDDQVNKLLEVEQRLGSRRFDLIKRERDVRLGLRSEMVKNESADATVIAQLIDQSIQLQKQRIDLLESEQRELATFLAPRQRAMYMGLQEQLRRQMEDVRDRREGGTPGVRRPRRPGDGPSSGRRPDAPPTRR